MPDIPYSASAAPDGVSLPLTEFATEWLWTYDNARPNMGIGGITPAQKLKMAA